MFRPYSPANVRLLLMAGVMQACAQAPAEYASVYTDLSGSACRIEKEDKETGASVERCSGVAGYSLLLHHDDARMSITVISPDGKQHPLDYWNVITRGFSKTGAKAEWRVLKRGNSLTPVALIVRVDASEGEPPKKRSYLAVAKITPQETCVTRKVEPAASANEIARKAADSASAEACIASK
jgi:hypothetical protein